MSNYKHKINLEFEKYKKNLGKRYMKFRNDADIKFSQYRYIEINADDFKNMYEIFASDVDKLLKNIDDFNLKIVENEKNENIKDKIIEYISSNISSKIADLLNKYKNDAIDYLDQWIIRNELCYTYDKYVERNLKHKFDIVELNIEIRNLKLKNKRLESAIVGLIAIIGIVFSIIYYVNH